MTTSPPKEMEPKQIGLYEFLIASELHHYYCAIKNELKISDTVNLKYATDEDLKRIGLSGPSINQLRTCYRKHYPTIKEDDAVPENKTEENKRYAPYESRTRRIKIRRDSLMPTLTPQQRFELRMMTSSESTEQNTSEKEKNHSF